MQKQIQIKSVSVIKEGNTNGRDWKIYKVQCQGDDEMSEFTTFKGDYVNAEGQQMIGEFEYSQQYKNWKEISATQAKENEKHEEIMNALREIFNLINDQKTPTINTDEVNANIPKGE